MSNSRRGRFRWRTRLRRKLPQVLIDLGIAGKGERDCGAHEWYRANDKVEHCYHCSVGHRPYDAEHSERLAEMPEAADGNNALLYTARSSRQKSV